MHEFYEIEFGETLVMIINEDSDRIGEKGICREGERREGGRDGWRRRRRRRKVAWIGAG